MGSSKSLEKLLRQLKFEEDKENIAAHSVVREGRTVAELDNEGITPEQVLSICYRSSGEGA